ncbi:ribosome production factor 2, partial [Phenoliferia sp. Uapishka_3]
MAPVAATPIIAPPKPKNARSKRAAEAREPVAVEKGAKTAIIVRSTTSSEKVKVALSELNQLKKPHSISFSKSNSIRPFEDSSSLAFWASKNDASLFLVGSHTKKRPHGLVWARCFAGEVMEMLEVGIEEVMAMSSFKSLKSSPGSIPLFHFASTSPNTSLWDSHPTYVQFKSILLDFFRGVEMDAIALKGLERVISVTIGGESAVDSAAAMEGVEKAVGGKGKEVASLFDGQAKQKGSGGDYDEEKGLPLVHFRTYSVSFLRSGVPTPLVALAPHGPHFTFSMRRSQQPSAEMWKAALKKTVKKASGGTKKNKNIDVDEMGDKVGRVYVDSQDLSGLQARKFKGLKRGPNPTEPSGGEGTEFGVVGGKVSSGGGGEGRKRPKVAAE